MIRIAIFMSCLLAWLGESHAQAGCTQSTLAMPSGLDEVDLYLTNEDFEKSIAAKALGKNIAITDCGDKKFMQITLNGEPRLVRKSQFEDAAAPAPSAAKSDECFCPGSRTDPSLYDHSSPGLGGKMPQCSKLECEK